MIHEEVISSYFRKMLAIVSFLWSAQLLYPVIFHWEVVRGVIGLDFWDAILVMVESSWFWSIIFFIPVLAHVISVYFHYMGRWVS